MYNIRKIVESQEDFSSYKDEKQFIEEKKIFLYNFLIKKGFSKQINIDFFNYVSIYFGKIEVFIYVKEEKRQNTIKADIEYWDFKNNNHIDILNAFNIIEKDASIFSTCKQIIDSIYKFRLYFYSK